jgi:hypothetical protein
MPTTSELTNALEGLQAISEAMGAALNQVGYGEVVESSDESVARSFTDEQYEDALETLRALLMAGEGLLERRRTGKDEVETEVAVETEAEVVPVARRTMLRGPDDDKYGWHL